MKICIVGGGPTGLSAGYELAKRGHRVTVYESEKVHGGLVGTFDVGKNKLEKYYHHIFTSDAAVIELIDELGISDRLEWHKPLNGIYMNGTLYPFTSPLDLLVFKELPLTARISMGLLVCKSRFVKEWHKLEGVTAREWIIKNVGKAVYDKIWGPLLHSKFDTDAEEVAAVWVWNKLKLRGSSRGKSIKAECLGYMKGSFGLLYDELVSRIGESGGKVEYSTPVREIRPRADKTIDVITDKGIDGFDRVIVTTAPAIFANMGLRFPGRYMECLSAIKYKANICMVLELSRSLSPYYWITVAEKGFPFVLVAEHTNMTGTAGYDSHVVYLSRYLDEGSALYKMADDQVKKLFLQHLKIMFPQWNESDIINMHIFRARYAQPVIYRNYSGIIPGFKTPVENLYFASMAQVYPEDRGQNYAVEMGKEIAAIAGAV